MLRSCIITKASVSIDREICHRIRSLGLKYIMCDRNSNLLMCIAWRKHQPRLLSMISMITTPTSPLSPRFSLLLNKPKWCCDMSGDVTLACFLLRAPGWTVSVIPWHRSCPWGDDWPVSQCLRLIVHGMHAQSCWDVMNLWCTSAQWRDLWEERQHADCFTCG